MALLQLEDPIELLVKRRQFLSRSGFLSRHDMAKAGKSDAKPHSFLPSQLSDSGVGKLGQVRVSTRHDVIVK